MSTGCRAGGAPATEGEAGTAMRWNFLDTAVALEMDTARGWEEATCLQGAIQETWQRYWIAVSLQMLRPFVRCHGLHELPRYIQVPIFWMTRSGELSVCVLGEDGPNSTTELHYCRARAIFLPGLPSVLFILKAPFVLRIHCPGRPTEPYERYILRLILHKCCLLVHGLGFNSFL